MLFTFLGPVYIPYPSFGLYELSHGLRGLPLSPGIPDTSRLLESLYHCFPGTSFRALKTWCALIQKRKKIGVLTSPPLSWQAAPKTLGISNMVITCLYANEVAGGGRRGGSQKASG